MEDSKQLSLSLSYPELAYIGRHHADITQEKAPHALSYGSECFAATPFFAVVLMQSFRCQADSMNREPIKNNGL